MDHTFHKLLRRLSKYSFILRPALLVLLAVLVTFSLVKLLPPLFRLPLKAFKVIKSPQSVLKTTNNRTNILLLGMGGAGHEAPNLTDTIIFFSINPTTHDAVSISLPRDFWIPSLRAKINTAYYYGDQKKPGGGLILAKASAEEVLGQPIHYALALNFDGFIRAIDLVGGIDIDIPQTFDDFKYPIPGKETAQPESSRYQPLHFDAGFQHFDGQTALKYVRSRNAEGEQGTDFARSRRQQQVILSFKQTLLSTQTLLNPQRLIKLKHIFADSLIHDFSDTEIIALAKLALSFNQSQVRSGILDAGDQDNPGLLINPPQTSRYDYQWVLTPRTSIDSVHQYVTDLIYQPNL